MKIKILALLCLSVILTSCGDGSEDILPDDTVGKSTTVITGAISTTLEYEAEFTHTILSSVGTTMSMNFGNSGQTESVVIFSLIDLNKQGFTSGTYNYTGPTSDPDLTSYFSGYYLDNITNAAYFINDNANAVNKITIKTITDTKITGEYELNLEKDYDGDKVKLVGTFEAVGTTLRQ